MHIGRNISKIRELLNTKQEQLAMNLKVSQQTVSKLEQTATIREQLIEKIAKALEVQPKMIIEFDETLLILFLQIPEGNSVDKLSRPCCLKKSLSYTKGYS